MRKVLIAIVLAVSMAGCAQLQGAFQAVTANYSNPVTPRMLYDIENSLTVAVSGLLAYKQACITKVVPASCRTIIANLQVYTRKAKPVLVQLRAFVKNNDQVNAVVAYNQVAALLSGFQQTATTAGVK